MEETIIVPATGKFIEMEVVLDPTFKQKMMGDGLQL
ncbi:PTS glucose transporter subunit IIA [Gracilibacillus ureilyticus]